MTTAQRKIGNCKEIKNCCFSLRFKTTFGPGHDMARSSRTSIWQERARNPSTRAYLGKTCENKEIEKTIDLHYVLKEKWAPEQNRQILQDYNLRIGSFARMPLRRAQDRMREVLAHKARE